MTITSMMSMPLFAATNSKANNGLIDEKKAIEIVLDDAKLNQDEVTIVKSNLGFDNGVQEYEIEFLKGNKEYDYDVNAKTGEIISSDSEIEDDILVASKIEEAKAGQEVHKMNREKAIDIAIEDSGLSNKEISYVEAYKDFDDGVEVYDIEIHTGNKEYSYDINAKTGRIMDFNMEFDD